MPVTEMVIQIDPEIARQVSSGRLFRSMLYDRADYRGRLSLALWNALFKTQKLRATKPWKVTPGFKRTVSLTT